MFQSFKSRWWNKANILALRKLSVAPRLPREKGATARLSAPPLLKHSGRGDRTGKRIALFIKIYQYMRLNTRYPSATNRETIKGRAKSRSTKGRST